MEIPQSNIKYVSPQLKKKWSDFYYQTGSNTYLVRMERQHITTSDFSFRTPKHNIPTFLLIFKYDWYKQFSCCMDIIAFDQPGKTYRFTIIYYLLSMAYNNRIQIITQTNELKGLYTATIVYSSLNWSEREVYDMYGILFLFHPDLRRILTDYGFTDFPLRKDFPLTGYQEILYSDYTKKIDYRAVELTQEFRKTEYTKVWKENKYWIENES